MRYVNDLDCLEAKRKRILYLFIKDLMKGVGGSVLDNKDSRENIRPKKVSSYSKVMAWVFVSVLNAGMLFYVYLFARTQTSSRQSAWLISFIMWFFFEIAVSSTAVVLLTHLIIPLYVLSDIRNIKKRVLTDILLFRKASLQALAKVPGAGAQPSNGSTSTEFNAAKYLYSSWRVASLFPSLKESEIILRFQTPWPQHCLKSETVKVTSSYERRYSFLYQAIGRVAIFFLASFLNLPQLAQDSLMQMTSNSALGYFGVLFIRLYGLNPYLIGVPLFLGIIIVHFGLQWTLKSEQVKKAQDLYPLEEEFSSAVVMPTDEEKVAAHGAVEWEEDDEYAERYAPSLVEPNLQAKQKIAEGRKMSQMMLNGLQQDLMARQQGTTLPHVTLPSSGVSLAELDELDPSFWSDSDEDNKLNEESGNDRFRIDSPSIELQEFDHSLSLSSSSSSTSSSAHGSRRSAIIWDDESPPLEDNSIDDSNVSIEFCEDDPLDSYGDGVGGSDSLDSSEFSLPSNDDESRYSPRSLIVDPSED
jgi:hypothetical protein